jgi:Protein of unknown function (DUF3098)
MAKVNVGSSHANLDTADQKVANELNGASVAMNEPVKHDGTYMFDKKNYMFMGIGLALIALGFILMAGGKSPDPKVFNYDDVYSFRRITLAPILIVAGYIMEIYAIMLVPKNNGVEL